MEDRLLSSRGYVYMWHASQQLLRRRQPRHHPDVAAHKFVFSSAKKSTDLRIPEF